jgi:AcrR family transcriptional regulator
LEAALATFAAVGTDAATIDMITERADLGKGTFYRHFADKSEILGVLIEQCTADLLDAIARAVGQPTSLRGALDGLVNGHMEFFLRHPAGFIVLFQGRMLLKLDRGLVYDIDRSYEGYLTRIEELVLPFLPIPVDEVKIRRLACAIAGFVSGFLSFAMITMEPKTVRESIEPMKGAFLGAVVGFMERP